MRKRHVEHIERWVKFIKTYPEEWKKIHSDFINSQFENSFKIIKRLSKTKEGAKKILEIYEIKNIKGYPNLLKKANNS